MRKPPIISAKQKLENKRNSFLLERSLRGHGRRSIVNSKTFPRHKLSASTLAANCGATNNKITPVLVSSANYYNKDQKFQLFRNKKPFNKKFSKFSLLSASNEAEFSCRTGSKSSSSCRVSCSGRSNTSNKGSRAGSKESYTGGIRKKKFSH